MKQQPATARRPLAGAAATPPPPPARCVRPNTDIVGREVYSRGYSASGPNARMYGAIIFDIALVGMLVGAIASAGAIAKLW